MAYQMPNEIEPTEVYAGAIAEFRGIWGDIDETIEKIETEGKELGLFKRALINSKRGQVESAHRTNSHMSLTEAAKVSEVFREINNEFFLKTSAALLWYQKNYDLPAMHHVEEYNLLRYQTGQEYKAHYDGGLWDRRAVSPIVYLNDSYEGGELEFVHFGFKIKPSEGSLFLFPSNYAYSHIAHPVTEGTKYAIVTWLYPPENRP